MQDEAERIAGERALDLLARIVEHYGDRRDGPGHCHEQPGIWDSDVSNGTKAGQPCEWCATWTEARTILQRGDTP